MNFGAIFWIALNALAINKMRSALTMRGIMIGVAAVITMVAVGAGAQERVQEQMKGLGSNIMLVIPGGIGGTEAMCADASVKQAVRDFVAAGKWVASICAGPTVLRDAGVLTGRRFTCHPACREDLQSAGTWVDERVVRDGNIVTSQAPGTAFAFALALVELLESRATAQNVAAGMLYPL